MSLLDKIFDYTPSSIVSTTEAGFDYDKIRDRIKKNVETRDNIRANFERQWFRSILYYIGNQWITWDARGGRWREKKLRRWVPKPVTNRYASTLDSIVSAIQSFKVQPSVWPATNDVEDIAATNVAERAIEIINNEIDAERIREAIAKWVCLNGDAFVLPYYDRNDQTLGKKFIQALRCTSCQTVVQPVEVEEAGGVCVSCGGMELAPAFDEVGCPIGKEYPVGRMRCEVFSPLQVYLNVDVPTMDQQTKFTIIQVCDIESVKARWPESAKNITTSISNQTGRHFMEAIANSVDDGGFRFSSGKERTTIFKHFEMPSEDFPDGLFAIMAGDETILEAGPSPFFEESGGSKNYYWPLVKFGYSYVPGRLYSKTPAYDLLGKQDQLNRLESLIELAAMKGAYTSWLLPAGSSVSQITGEAGQIIRYTPTGTGGARPEVITQAPFAPIILEYKHQLQEDFEELGGTFDALKGNVPRGVSAGYAIQLLTERSYGRFATVFANWERGWVELYTNLLKIFRTYVTEERLHKIKGASGAWEISKFKGADLRGSVDIKIEGGASRPRSKIAEQALIESLFKMGVVNTADPEQRIQVAETFGMAGILGASDEDQRHAAAEWDLLLNYQPQPIIDPNTGQPVADPDTGAPMMPQPDENGNLPGAPFFDPVIDNHAVHIMDHTRRAKTDVFKRLEPWKQTYWRNHILSHKMALMPPPMVAPAGPDRPPTSKANEVLDKTMATIREGGSAAFGAGGKNQF